MRSMAAFCSIPSPRALWITSQSVMEAEGGTDVDPANEPPSESFRGSSVVASDEWADEVADVSAELSAEVSAEELADASARESSGDAPASSV
ncbi:MAG: hypothetical protein AB8G96_02335 [Phycisphaerales bacterium]